MPGRDIIDWQLGEIAKNLARGEAAAAALPALSLHASALVAAGLATDDALTDRQLAIRLLEWGTRKAAEPGQARWATYPLGHGAGVSQALLRAAGLDPDHEPVPCAVDDDEGDGVPPFNVAQARGIYQPRHDWPWGTELRWKQHRGSPKGKRGSVMHAERSPPGWELNVKTPLGFQCCAFGRDQGCTENSAWELFTRSAEGGG